MKLLGRAAKLSCNLNEPSLDVLIRFELAIPKLLDFRSLVIYISTDFRPLFVLFGVNDTRSNGHFRRYATVFGGRQSGR